MGLGIRAVEVTWLRALAQRRLDGVSMVSMYGLHIWSMVYAVVVPDIGYNHLDADGPEGFLHAPYANSTYAPATRRCARSAT